MLPFSTIMIKSCTKSNFFLVFILFITSCSCSNTQNKRKTECQFLARIEIPAGTNEKYEYNKVNKEFECELINGEKRIINYLPYLGNYGFLENTFMNPLHGGDGDALDVLVISESKKQGSSVCVKPIAILKLKDNGKEDHKIIAIPEKTNLSFINDSLPKSAKEILKNWFCNYKGPNQMEFISWGNKEEALSEINKWEI